MQNTISFGGKLLLFVEDFWDTLLVVSSGSRAQIASACAKSSVLYHCSQTVRVTEAMALQSLLESFAASEEAVQFPKFLLEVGEGMVSPDEGNYIKVPQYICNVSSRKYLCFNIFEIIKENHTNQNWLECRAINKAKNVYLQTID